MSRKVIIAGNWKMNKTPQEAVTFVDAVKNQLHDNVEAVVCAPFVALPGAVLAAQGTSLSVAAQNMHFEERGAFTGEVSADMLLATGVKYVVIGHSERREMFNETDATVNAKTKVALAKGIVPIVCCGETLEEREEGITSTVVETQIRAALEGIEANVAPQIVIAYEPIWAIGTGKTATAEQANEVCSYIRKVVGSVFGPEVSEAMRIQYGGSVSPDNVSEILAQSDIDGALVGGASLEVESYLALINAAK